MAKSKFKPERLFLLRKLKNMTVKDIKDGIESITGHRVNNLDINRWEKGEVTPRDPQLINMMAQAMNVPYEFFFSSKVSIKMYSSMVVRIRIKDRKVNEVRNFKIFGQ